MWCWTREYTCTVSQICLLTWLQPLATATATVACLDAILINQFWGSVELNYKKSLWPSYRICCGGHWKLFTLKTWQYFDRVSKDEQINPEWPLVMFSCQMVGMFEVSLQTKQLLLIGRFFSVFRWITSIFLVNNLCRSLSMWTRDPIEIVISCWSLSWEDEPCTLNWESTAEAWVLCLIYRIKSELKTSQAIRWTWIFTGVFRNKILYHSNKFSFSGVETN